MKDFVCEKSFIEIYLVIYVLVYLLHAIQEKSVIVASGRTFEDH
jgi:hypothetical protein